MKRAAVFVAIVALAGCGSHAAPPDHATQTDLRVHADSVDFAFDSRVRDVSATAARAPFAECGSGARVSPRGTHFVVVKFSPAQTRGLPKRVIMPSGRVLEVSKVCDFEADVSWVVGLDRRAVPHVSRDGSTVTVSFGG